MCWRGLSIQRDDRQCSTSFRRGPDPPPAALPLCTQCLQEAAQRTGDEAIDIVICDTAGRLHTAYALMEELQAGGPPDVVMWDIMG
jgi:hypothetical protein